MKRVKIFTDTAIDTISVERLLEKVYLEYMTDIEDAVVRCAAVEEQMPQLVAEFRGAVDFCTFPPRLFHLNLPLEQIMKF